MIRLLADIRCTFGTQGICHGSSPAQTAHKGTSSAPLSEAGSLQMSSIFVTQEIGMCG